MASQDRKRNSVAGHRNAPRSRSSATATPNLAVKRLQRTARSRVNNTQNGLAPYYAMAADVFLDDNMLNSTLNSDLDVSFLKAARVRL